jgi:hypothetical protein
VQLPRQPVESGTISTCALRRSFGRSSAGSAFLASSHTVLPFSVSDAASTTRSICVTPNSDSPARLDALRSPCGTHPATSSALLAARPDDSSVSIALCDGDFTVHVLMSHKSADAASSTSA